MSTIEESIEIDVPVRTAYNQWTQFETFPEFMEGVKEVRQLDDTHLHWTADVGGVERQWDAEITEQKPDERVAWRAREGADNAGVVTFHRLSDERTRVMLQMEFDPVSDWRASADYRRRVAGNLLRRCFLESTVRRPLQLADREVAIHA